MHPTQVSGAYRSKMLKTYNSILIGERLKKDTSRIIHGKDWLNMKINSTVPQKCKGEP